MRARRRLWRRRGWGRKRPVDDEPRYDRPDELQPGDWRRGKRTDRPRDRRPRRRDGRAIDATGIQFRVLNRSKGPAMHGPRAQADKKAYQFEIKRLCEEQPNLSIRQETVDDIITEVNGGEGDSPIFAFPAARGPPRKLGQSPLRLRRLKPEHRRTASPVSARPMARSTVPAPSCAAGTFMRGLIHVGEAQMSGGRMGETGHPRHQRRAAAAWLSTQRSRPARRSASTAAPLIST